VLGHGLSHATAVGTRQILVSAVARGATIVTCTPFEPNRFLEMAAEEGIETAVLPAAVGTSLLRSLDSGAAPRPSRLRRLRFISDALSPEVHRGLADRLQNCRVINSYGLTEGGDAHLVVTQDDCHLGPGGYPAPGTEARILSEEGQWLSPGAEGYICLRDAQAPLSYLTHTDQATATWRDGWTVTADRGVMAADGRIHFTGRNESLARVGGRTVSLPQVQSLLERHPAVTSAAVLAVEHPALGQVLAAVVESSASAEALKMRRFLREWLPEHAVPAVTVPTVAIPRLRTGKPNPEAIRALVRAHLDAEPRDCLPGTQSMLATVWERVLRPGRRVGPDDDFFELGGDSMAAVEVMVCLESEYGVEIPVDVMFAASNLAELAAELDRLVRTP
jgi:acyl-coenzyme A synthetase/AMP-(fatty) acid ligase/acyl carrier protein